MNNLKEVFEIFGVNRSDGIEILNNMSMYMPSKEYTEMYELFFSYFDN